MKLFKEIKLIKIIVVSFFIFSSFISVSLADYDFAENTGLKTTAEKTGHTEQRFFNGPEALNDGIGQIVQIVLSLIGVVFMVLLVFGGIQWMTAAGNDQQVEKAKNVIIRSIIGLAIILLAYVISIFIITAFSNSNLLD